jgi:hypothetical protein
LNSWNYRYKPPCLALARGVPFLDRELEDLEKLMGLELGKKEIKVEK